MWCARDAGDKPPPWDRRLKERERRVVRTRREPVRLDALLETLKTVLAVSPPGIAASSEQLPHSTRS